MKIRGDWMAKIRFLTALLLLMVAVTCGESRAEERKYQRTVENYNVPDVVLVNQDGSKVRFRELVQSKKPVIVDFIFGTCTTICPILSVGYANLQQKLGPDSQKVQLVSISIDPEHDTPKVMKEYLRRYRAKPGWDFLTGSRGDIEKLMYAFNAYIPNKMSHFPLTLIRSPEDGKWIRIFGLMGSSEFLGECRKAGIK
jgi:protein SCO1/2